MSSGARTVVCTILALAAFAANSILCRAALERPTIDAATFSTLRLASGAAVLILITIATRRDPWRIRGTWRSGTALFLYAVPFSLAYVHLDAGAGALILFGTVQATMILAAIRAGERPGPLQWLGLSLALGGLVYLGLPGLGSPSRAGAALMALAGFSWGIYSLRGRQAPDALLDTTGNFARAVPLALATSLVFAQSIHVSLGGAVLAMLSGALASALGYVVWYAALRGLTATRAALLQLTVPVLAGAGGVVVLAESPSSRLLVAAVLILGGVGLALAGGRGAPGRQGRRPSRYFFLL